MNRSEAQVVRLAMIYALLDKSLVIEICHLEAAISAWDYCEASAKYIFYTQNETRVSKKIVSILRDGPKTKTEISKAFSCHLKRAALNDALRELESNNQINATRIKTAGAPKTLYSLINSELCKEG